MANLQFIDEVNCPLPAGVQVTIYGMGANGFQIPGAIQAPALTTYTHQLGSGPSGGNLQVTWPANPPPFYIAYFVGNEAPPSPQIFASSGTGGEFYDTGLSYDVGNIYDGTTGNPTIVTVYNYRSPCKTYDEYANEGSLLQPKGWYSPTALAEGGVLNSVMQGILAGHGSEDGLAEIIHESLRLGSCSGKEIDTWAFDMLGPQFQRFAGETDVLFILRIMLMIGRPRCTIRAIQNIVYAFYNSIQGEPGYPNANNLAFGRPMAGGSPPFAQAGGFNTGGAFNTVATGGTGPPPASTVIVWDGITLPAAATLFGIKPTQFVIQIGRVTVGENQLLAFNLAGAFNRGSTDVYGGAFNFNPGDGPTETPSPFPPDWRLGVIINLIAKPAGIQPLYIVGT